MLDFRLYLFEGGHIVRAFEFECATDQEAIVQAEPKRGLYHAELWQRGRLVHSFTVALGT